MNYKKIEDMTFINGTLIRVSIGAFCTILNRLTLDGSISKASIIDAVIVDPLKEDDILSDNYIVGEPGGMWFSAKELHAV